MDSDEPIIRARDLMERDVITVALETRILDVHRLFVEQEVHGAPVVGEDGVVYGVLSALDLLRIVRHQLGGDVPATSYFRDELPCAGPEWLRMPEEFRDRMLALTAADVMTRKIVMVGPDATVDALAGAMLEHRIHRVLVGEAGVLQGVITTFDLLRVLSRASGSLGAGPIRHTGYSRGEVRRGITT